MSILELSENGGALVSINPKRSVEFNLQQIIDGSRHCSALLVVKNVSPRPIAFKVKTTHLGWYFVKPNQDVLKEGESKEVVITLTDMESKRILEAASRGVFESLDRHRFRVQAKPISAADYELISCVPIHLKGEKSAHIWGNDTTMSRSDKRLRVELTYPPFLTSAPGSPDSLDEGSRVAAGLSSSVGWRGDANTTAGAADLTTNPDGQPSPVGGQQGQRGGGEGGVRFAPSSSSSPDVDAQAEVWGGQRERAVTANLSPNSLDPAAQHQRQSRNQSASTPSDTHLSPGLTPLGQGQASSSSSSSSSSSPNAIGYSSQPSPSTATTSPESSTGDHDHDLDHDHDHHAFPFPDAPDGPDGRAAFSFPSHDTAGMVPSDESAGLGIGMGMGVGMGLEAAPLTLQREVIELRMREREREQVPLWARSPPGKSYSSSSASRRASASAVKPNVLVLCTGSVAALKAPELVAALCVFANVRLVLSSPAAQHFLARAEEYNPAAWAAFEAAGGRRLIVGEEHEWIWAKLGDPVVHIALRKWAHVAVLAPASADALAKVSAGICDSLLLSVLRAWDFRKPVIAAPAMNTLMWSHPATKVTLLQLRLWGYRLLEPQAKMLACREEGRGALAAVVDIVEAVREALDSYDWVDAWAAAKSDDPSSASASASAYGEEEEDGSSGLAFLKPAFLSSPSSASAPVSAPASAPASPVTSKRGGGRASSPPSSSSPSSSSSSPSSTATVTVAVAGGASLLALAALLLLAPAPLSSRSSSRDLLEPGRGGHLEAAASAAATLKAVMWSAWGGAVAASARWPRDVAALTGMALSQTSSALGLKL